MFTLNAHLNIKKKIIQVESSGAELHLVYFIEKKNQYIYDNIQICTAFFDHGIKPTSIKSLFLHSHGIKYKIFFYKLFIFPDAATYIFSLKYVAMNNFIKCDIGKSRVKFQ